MRISIWIACVAFLLCSTPVVARAPRQRQRVVAPQRHRPPVVRARRSAKRARPRARVGRGARHRSLAGFARSLFGRRRRVARRRGRRTPTAQRGVAGRRLRGVVELKQLKLLREIRRLVPGLVPKIAVRRRSILLEVRGHQLGPDVYLAPYAMNKLRRQLLALNAGGIFHNAVSRRNIVVNEVGELLLLGGWGAASRKRRGAGDLAALSRLERALARGNGG